MRDSRDKAIINEFAQRAADFLTGGSNLHSSLVPAALLAAAINDDAKTYSQFKNASKTRQRDRISFYEGPSFVNTWL